MQSPATRAPAKELRVVPTHGLAPRGGEGIGLGCRADAVSRTWLGQARQGFRELVNDWESRFPNLARKLVWEKTVFHDNDAIKLATFQVLKSAKDEGEANWALSMLTTPEACIALFPRIERIVASNGNLQEVRDLLAAHAGIKNPRRETDLSGFFVGLRME